jgi:hypothetical protein
MLSVLYASYALCHKEVIYAECRYAECRYTGCHGYPKSALTE